MIIIRPGAVVQPQAFMGSTVNRVKGTKSMKRVLSCYNLQAVVSVKASFPLPYIAGF